MDEQIPVHEYYHLYPSNRSILELPMEETAKHRFQRYFTHGARPVHRRFYVRSFSQNGVLKLDNLRNTIEFIDIVASTESHSYLSSIYLVRPNSVLDFRLDYDVWLRLMTTIKDTLSEIHLENVDIEMDPSSTSQSIMPNCIPNLRRFCIEKSQIHVDRLFAENLSKCRDLKLVRIQLNLEKESKELMAELNRIQQAQVDVGILVWLRRQSADQIFDGEEFKGLRSIATKIKAFSIIIDHWDDRLPRAIERMVHDCVELRKLSVTKFDPCKNEEGGDRRFESRLLGLFANCDRARKLTDINWIGECEEDVLKSILKNCKNLVSLSISDCPQLRAVGVSDWGTRNPRLRMVTLPRGQQKNISTMRARRFGFGEPGNDEIAEQDDCDTCAGFLAMEMVIKPAFEDDDDEYDEGGRKRKKKGKKFGCF